LNTRVEVYARRSSVYLQEPRVPMDEIRGRLRSFSVTVCISWMYPSAKSRAVRIELFTAWVLCGASYRVLEYSTDTGSGY